MKKTTHYSRIESVAYEFSESDILNALLAHYKIKRGNSLEFDIIEEYTNANDEAKPAFAELIVRFNKEDEGLNDPQST